MGFSKKETEKEQNVVVKTYSEKIMDLLNSAESMLNDSKQSVEIKGTLIYLKQAKGSLSQAGKFQKTSPTKED